ncbi:MAG: recombinase family protein, partial [Planctomycetes bacterium]|nr:recombinase family protein [Planctomycetota bacterium]
MNRLSLNDITDDAIGAVAQQVTGEHARCGDRAGGYQRTCPVCGKVFVAARPQALYCSPRCKRAVLLRRCHEAEAIVWRHIFRRFIQLGSCMLVARELNREGHRTKAWTARSGAKRGGAPWNKAYVHWTLTNHRYVGEVMHQGQAYPGEHEAIVDRRVWDRVHAILDENRPYRASQTRRKT